MAVMEEIQRVLESLPNQGTRYHVEKLALIGLYVVLVGTTAAWVFAGGRLLASRYAADFRVSQLEAIGSQRFYLTNTGTAKWRDVRIELSDRYLARLEQVNQGERKELKPEDFRYFYRVPRHWGAADWESLTSAAAQPMHAPGTVEVSEKTIEIGSRHGAIDVRVIGTDSDTSS